MTIGPITPTITMPAGSYTTQWDTTFTGPWGSRSEDFSDTSFGIATGILSDLREIIQSKNLRVELQTFLIERDDTAFKQLRAAIERLRVPGIEPVHGEFAELLPTLPIRPNDFVFLFIDPKGWNIDSRVVGAFTRRHRTEVLITFMSSFINRFIDVDQVRDTFDPLFSRDNWIEEFPQRGVRTPFDLYQAFEKTCREVYGFQFVAQSEVLKPGRDEDHYVMFFGTNHPKGLFGFREAQLRAIQVQAEAWSSVRDRGAPHDLFKVAGLSLNHLPAALSDPRYEADRMGEYILSRVRSVGEIQCKALLIECAERFIIKRSTFNDFISSQHRSGRLKVPAIAGRRRVPKDDDLIVSASNRFADAVQSRGDKLRRARVEATSAPSRLLAACSTRRAAPAPPAPPPSPARPAARPIKAWRGSAWNEGAFLIERDLQSPIRQGADADRERIRSRGCDCLRKTSRKPARIGVQQQIARFLPPARAADSAWKAET